MILAQQLHKSHDCFQVYLEMVRVLTAVHFNNLSEEIEPRLTADDRVTYMAEEHEKLAEDGSVVTEPFLIQGGTLGTVCFLCSRLRPGEEVHATHKTMPTSHSKWLGCNQAGNIHRYS